MNYKGKIVVQVIASILVGLLVARFSLDGELTFKNAFFKFDVICHILMIVGFFMMSLGKKNAIDK
ncbi:hypothetical protein H7U19_02500 [Hyunsoonleella sp. SJ7]|uniref:Uncharacterized protein n=1 Tax=Hyunsoonleella aquatilis TaxID=2762758 RepID=A0A923H966_9FLAO|nr:hypothetical protein [Hyunsoonleella aquatilis]MBC3757257.1 hypothetical protein [Hyunsoonleella aquatilis]